jgi:hypothetical protein
MPVSVKIYKDDVDETSIHKSDSIANGKKVHINNVKILTKEDLQ